MKCPGCGAKMVGTERGSMLVLECPKCGYKTYEEMDGPDYDDMPEGCAACGGNWPDCADSCPMYD